jgi:HD-like signal output (HDOD) protein
MLDGIIEDWHASIGKAILENWGFSEEMATAVGEQDDHSRSEPGDAELRDVLAVAILMASHTDPAMLEVALQDLESAQRLGLTEAKLRQVSQECAAEVAALNNALGS